MPLQNLEQVRAKSALEFARSDKDKGGAAGGEAIKKIPPMVMTNGLLAAIAFSIEKNRQGKYQREGFANICDAIAKHLSSEEIRITTAAKSATDLLDCLVTSDSEVLKLATAETLEWLAYARRFVQSPNKEAKAGGRA